MVVLFSSNLEVSFPKGTLPSKEHSYTLVLDYDDALYKILNEWAIPKQMD